MEFIIVSGLSGAGKTRAMHALEDIDFYCVDNIPAGLIPTFYSLFEKSNNDSMKHMAVVVDIRANSNFNKLFESLKILETQGKKYKILFLDAKDDILVKRFRESRRKHPLASMYKGSILSAIKFERKLLSRVKQQADYVIDTSLTSTADLKKRVLDLFLEEGHQALKITCMSFGFKYGVPAEADLVFDVRCLPNPFYIDEMRHKTGLDDQVKEYVFKWDSTKGFVERIISLIDYVLPLYLQEGKSQLVIAIGCTGGKHRSVAIAQHLYRHILSLNKGTSVSHRDLTKE